MVLARAIAIVAVVGACGDEPPCGPRDDGSVVACLDGAPVTAAEVAEHLGPAEPVAGRADLADPRRRALDAAVRVRLFADEAAARGLEVRGAAVHRRSALYQALIRDEAARAGAVPERIDVDEARRYYEAHPGEFNKITEVECRAIFVSDPARAESLYAEVAGGDEATFVEAAMHASEDPSADAGGAIGEAHAEGMDPALTRVANDLRARGAVGGPVRLADGRYAIVQAAEVRMVIKPYDDAMAATVRNALAHRREAAALDALEARLRAAHTLEVFADALARVR